MAAVDVPQAPLNHPSMGARPKWPPGQIVHVISHRCFEIEHRRLSAVPGNKLFPALRVDVPAQVRGVVEKSTDDQDVVVSAADQEVPPAMNGPPEERVRLCVRCHVNTPSPSSGRGAPPTSLARAVASRIAAAIRARYRLLASVPNVSRDHTRIEVMSSRAA